MTDKLSYTFPGKFLLSSFMLLLLSQGCATRQQVMEVDTGLAELKARNDEKSREIDSLKVLVVEERDLIMSAKADVLAEVSSLKEQVYVLGNQLSERDREVPMEFGEQMADSGIVRVAPTDEAEPPGQVAEGAIQHGQETAPMDERVTYDTAFLDMTRGNYELAADGFRTFIASSSGSQLLDNAQYWVGECYYALGDLRRAIEEFELVIKNYPRGNKIPSALFKIGKCYFELDDRDAAGRYFKSVIDGYPRSEEANLARDYLTEL